MDRLKSKAECERVLKKAQVIKQTNDGSSLRYSFSRIGDSIEIPELLKIQQDSYDRFVEKGIKEVLAEISPIMDHTGNLILEIFDYYIEPEIKYSIEECIARKSSYTKRLIVKTRLINRESGEIKEQEIFLGDMPVMTEFGSFVINGVERVVITQLLRSPGVYFTLGDQTNQFRAKKLYNGQIMPERGSWIEFESDNNDVVYTRVDRTRKIPVTVLIKALGIEKNDDILKIFADDAKIINTLEKDTTETKEEAMIEIYKKLRPGELQTYDAAKTYFEQLFFEPRRYDLSEVGRYKYNKKLDLATRLKGKKVAAPVINPETGEILAEEGEVLTLEKANEIQNTGINMVLVKGNSRNVNIIGNGTVDLRAFVSEKICANLGLDETEKVNYIALKDIIEKSSKKDLEKNLKDSLEDLVPLIVTKEDIFASISYFLGLDAGIGLLDNIDHLGNRRVRTVGELLKNQFRIGMVRLEKIVRERMTTQDTDTVTSQSLINTRPVTSAIREFFGGSQLSQLVENTNALSSVSSKRKISALGPGGLTKERAGFEVRDVHSSHYGRICPIETPEGSSIGLILNQSLFARINKYGFIETPYRVIDTKTKKLTDKIVYMTADEEENYVIAQITEKLDKNGKFINDKVKVRKAGEIVTVSKDEVELIDVSPKQMFAAGPSLIPFLENDDANRALMGANMQRQGVPLIKQDSPMVGTGMEHKVAVDSKHALVAKNPGTVEKVTGDEIVIKTKDGKDVYTLTKFQGTKEKTCNNQKPIVKEGEKVKKGKVIADGMTVANGELALGKNVIVAFMPWEGYNYEDSILINENLVREDVYTSIHIIKNECEARDTQQGPEEITRDVPNLGEDALKELDENGIIRVGAKVKPGDILVGKITPKGDTEPRAEEKLLRAIFGEKAKETKDSSLRVNNGEYGTVIGVRKFSKANGDSDLKPGVNEVVRVYIAQKRKISVGDKMAGRHGNKGVVSRILPVEDMPYLEDGTPVDIVLNPLGVPSRMNLGQVLELHLGEVARQLGVKFATPIFDGASDVEIQDLLEELGLDRSGKKKVIDGRTGRPFENEVSVGIMYMLKLHHLVDEKIHARSTGSYSLVTQQPLGGKASFGGQRLGEMEVWALQAYGASYNLREMLTIKSDDVVQRTKAYESIVKGQNIPDPSVPESFKVFVKEVESLGLKLDFLDEDGNVIDMNKEDILADIKSREEIPTRKRHRNAKLTEEEKEIERERMLREAEESFDYDDYDEDEDDEDLDDLVIYEEVDEDEEDEE